MMRSNKVFLNIGSNFDYDKGKMMKRVKIEGIRINEALSLYSTLKIKEVDNLFTATKEELLASVLKNELLSSEFLPSEVLKLVGKEKPFNLLIEKLETITNLIHFDLFDINQGKAILNNKRFEVKFLSNASIEITDKNEIKSLKSIQEAIKLILDNSVNSNHYNSLIRALKMVNRKGEIQGREWKNHYKANQLKK